LALSRKNQLDDAIQAYRRAIELKPDRGETHCNLGGVLQRQGKYSESLAEYRKGHELGSKTPGWNYPSAAWVRRAEILVNLDARLPDILAAKDKPADNSECLYLAQMCQEHKKLFASSARFYARAFESDPELAKSSANGHQYNASCAAALAGCGQGNDVDRVDEMECARLRTQALEWLRADLTYWTKQTISEKAADRAKVQQPLKHWQGDSDLVGIRDKDALSKLPTEEQESFNQLWAEVEAVLKKAQEKPK
jgi:tetratricopeptide (TPR) repeat protein